MDVKSIATLKKIALLGGVDDYVAVSSRELGDELGMSQQSASKRILDLLDEKLIERDLGARRQRIKLSAKGLDVIREEYNDYRRIFELEDSVIVHGVVSSGMGEGGYYICQKEYMVQFERELGFVPFEGTLNLTVDKDEMNKIEMIRSAPGHRIKGFTDNGRSFGDVILHKAKLKNIECAVIIPERSHYKSVLEIICQYHLRRTLSLSDGSPVDLKVDIM